MLSEIFNRFERIITVEDGTIVGGLFSAVTEFGAKHSYKAEIRGSGIPDEYIHQASQEEQRAQCGLTTAMIQATICEEIKKTSKKDRKVLEIRN